MTRTREINHRVKLDTRLMWVALGEMRPAEIGRGQRELRQYRVDRITGAGFDPEIMGYPVVSQRDGHYFVIDGQARVEACKEWIGDDWQQQRVECRVFTDLTPRDEARIFLALNSSTQVDAFAKFQNGVSANLPDETEVDKLVRGTGLIISREDTDNAVGCVSALMRVYRRAGGSIFAITMRTVRDAYGRPGMRAEVIDGIGLLSQRYNGQLAEADAVERLASARGGVHGLLGRARLVRERTSTPIAVAVAAAAVEIINQGRRPASKRIRPWFEGET